MITNEFITAVLTGSDSVTVGGQFFNRADRAAIQWQYRRATMGSFQGTLWDLIVEADGGNLHRISLGFPEEVDGYRSWIMGNLVMRLQVAAENWVQ